MGRLGVERGNGRGRESEFGGVRENSGRTVENSDWGVNSADGTAGVEREWTATELNRERKVESARRR